MRELFPDLGEGFVERCLQECGGDSERVVNCLFEGALPPYPLCPMLGDCFDSINTTLSNQLEEHVQT